MCNHKPYFSAEEWGNMLSNIQHIIDKLVLPDGREYDWDGKLITGASGVSGV